MRQIAILPEQTARLFADYLFTLEVETQLLPEPTGLGVWVRDEDKVPRARAELVEFERNPRDTRYQLATSLAAAQRKLSPQTEDPESEPREDEEKTEIAGLDHQKLLTYGLVLASVVLTLLSRFGESDSFVTQALTIAPYQSEGNLIRWNWLASIREGEVWRLVTPIFLHFSAIHLVFNMLMLLSLGSRIEGALGFFRYLAMVLVIAVLSNLAEYYLEWSLGGEEGRAVFQFTTNPQFGGMSGVIYGLFGYLWMKSRLDPESGMEMPRETVVVMMVWFAVCLTGAVGNIANVAHGAGLLVGMFLGAVPQLWRRRGRLA